MSWDAIGAIGEVVGAIAVVISLLYLASQIRTSNKTARQSANQELMGGISEWVDMISSSGEMADIWNRGNMNPNSLSNIESIRYSLLLAHNFAYWERVFFMGRSGEIDNWVVEKMTRIRRSHWQYPGYRKHVVESEESIAREFLETVQKEMQEIPELSAGET